MSVRGLQFTVRKSVQASKRKTALYEVVRFLTLTPLLAAQAAAAAATCDNE